MSSTPADLASRLMQPTRLLLDAMLQHAASITRQGSAIDDHQVLTRRIAALATHVEAANALHAYAQHTTKPRTDAIATLFCAETAREVFRAAEDWQDTIELAGDNLAGRDDAIALARSALDESAYRTLGAELIEQGAENHDAIWASEDSGSDAEDLRTATRKFARTVVAPEAEAIHRQDLLVPEHFITQMAELGYFGMSVPEAYGGVGMSNVMMVVATEELSAASLSAAGSLITRPEILCKALLQGGTEEQKANWLPKVAAGEIMVAVAVTEPDTGSDVAQLACRAVPAMVDGREGYCISGAKAWCTFAGRADILALLARTDPDTSTGHKGLSLFIVEKDVFEGHEFDMRQPGGGRLTGKADATIGYRGMHSFTLQFEDYFVPAENLVGGDAGEGKGFYLQMGGFAAGRLQTGGRAVGLAQASLETAVEYTKGRPQFGRPIAEFQSTQYEIGLMAVEVEAARQLTHAAARAMDATPETAGLLAAMAKRFACRVAVNVSQRAQVLHGGWGYAEEYAISRYVSDALVLPIFEGVEPILEMKVIGRALLNR